MKIILTVIFAVLFFGAFHSCAQTKEVVKAGGYYRIPQPGTIPVDEAGEPVPLRRDTVYYLVVETIGQAVQWERAWHGGRSFSLISEKIERETQLGNEKAGQTVLLKPVADHSLWQLELADDLQQAKPPKSIDANSVLLQGKKDGRSFYVTVSPLTELASPAYQ